MPRILHVNGSARGTESYSLAIAQEFLEERVARDQNITVDTWNLFDDELPEFGSTAAAAKMSVFTGSEMTGEQAAAWANARAVYDRFIAADYYVFNVPMWNAGVPYALKQWIDLLTQPGWVFGFDPDTGYTGLVRGKGAFVVYTSGVYHPGVGANFGSDFAAPFFDDWLSFIGLEDVQTVRFAPTVLTADPAAGFEQCKQEARKIAGSL